MVDQTVALPPDVVSYLEGVFKDESAAQDLPPGAFTVMDALAIAKRNNPLANKDQVYQQLERRVARGELCKRKVPTRERAGRRVIEHAFYWLAPADPDAATAAPDTTNP